MRVDLATFHQHAALVAHVSTGGARGLLVGVVVLHCVAGRRDGAVALLGLLGVPRVPDLDLLNVLGAPASAVQGVFQVASIVTEQSSYQQKYLDSALKHHNREQYHIKYNNKHTAMTLTSRNRRYT